MTRIPMPPETKAADLLRNHGRRISKYIVEEILNSYNIDTLTNEQVDGEVDNDDSKYWRKVKSLILSSNDMVKIEL